MSISKNSRRTLIVTGLVGLAVAASAGQAFARGGGGGHFGGGAHFGGGRMGGFARMNVSAPRMNVSRMSFTPRVMFNAPRIGPHFGMSQLRPAVGPHFGTTTQLRPAIGPHFGRPFPQLGNRPFQNQAGNAQGMVLSPKCQFARCHIMVPATQDNGIRCFRAPCNMTGKLNPGPFLPPPIKQSHIGCDRGPCNVGPKPQVMCIRAPCNVNIPKQTQPPVVMCIRAPCNVGPIHVNPNDPMLHPAKNPCAFGRCQGPFGPQPYPQQIYYPPQPAYQPQPAAYQPQPSYAPAYQAPAQAAYSAPVPAPAPAAVQQQPTTVSVIFQPTATSNDITSFIKAYNVTVSSGPDASGIYRLQVSTGPVQQDQLNQIVQSMQSQTNVVAQVGA